jgi:(1->4)-alpha-D-glucan 1-alpha-D-glucosylmutase
MRFQQLTGPVMAKGVEDTAFYRYVRFAMLNEVGGRPDRWGVSLRDFHAANVERLERWPSSMTATSTHDTKRGEDVRARLAVLSEIPDEWRARVDSWLELGKRFETQVDDESAPSRTDQYLFFQTVVGAYPMDVPERPPEDFVHRVAEYQIKAAREAKLRTSWVSTNDAYEEALKSFVEKMCADPGFQRGVVELVGRIVRRGATNGIAQVLLKICAPGVPDTYQGSEIWNLALVDPDNRRPVDFEKLRGMLGKQERLLTGFQDGRLKLHVVQRALLARRDNPGLFIHGRYTPIEAGENVVGFVREHEGTRLVCVVPRQTWKLGGDWPIGVVWKDARLAVPSGRWRDVMTGSALESRGEVAVGSVLRELPVALLLEER